MSEEIAEVADATRQCVTFRLDSETYAIDVMQVREVLRACEIVPVPGAPAFILGIINLRGNVVTVMDARMRFGLPPAESDDSSRIIILESDDQVIGILVDSVAEVIEIDTRDLEPAPTVGEDDSNRYVEGVVSGDDGLVILVDLNRLLSREEWQTLSAI